MTPILIVPGLGGSSETHWQTHMQRALAGTIRVEQDDWDRPDLARWLDRLAQAVEVWPGAVLVAHSLGCPLVAHLAQQRPDLDIAAALLVAPADVDSARHTPRRTHGFAPIPLRPLRFRSIVVASTDDSYITIDRAQELADAWEAEFVDAGPAGHINVASGFGPWPAGLRMVESLKAAAGAPRPESRTGLRAAARAR